jgi:NAD(P)-dependent dehydrogenase (short-subunit alcohol dehydrogenase family)
MTNHAPAAVITGSTSGIGKAIAQRLLHAGYSVVLNYARNRERAEEALAECRLISTAVRLVQADIANTNDAARLIATATEEFGRLDLLINNAATVADKPVLELTEQDWDTVLDNKADPSSTSAPRQESVADATASTPARRKPDS